MLRICQKRRTKWACNETCSWYAHMADALLYCRCRHTYLQSLPRRAYIPIFWTDEEARLLQVGQAVSGTA
jgi:hypothetical protein